MGPPGRRAWPNRQASLRASTGPRHIFSGWPGNPGAIASVLIGKWIRIDDLGTEQAIRASAAISGDA